MLKKYPYKCTLFVLFARDNYDITRLYNKLNNHMDIKFKFIFTVLRKMLEFQKDRKEGVGEDGIKQDD